MRKGIQHTYCGASKVGVEWAARAARRGLGSAPYIAAACTYLSNQLTYHPRAAPNSTVLWNALKWLFEGRPWAWVGGSWRRNPSSDLSYCN
jgi:hypothetical protein